MSSQPVLSASAQPGGGTFRYGIGEPTTVVPPLVRSEDDRAVVDAVFDSLTAWDDSGAAIPAAAVSWSPNEQLDEWTFDLRPGATFHDGSPVTATDFRDTWSMLVAEGMYGYLLQDVIGYQAVAAGEQAILDGVAVSDDLTLQIRLSRPRADLPVLMGHPALGPVNSRQVAADPDGWGDQPIGNGPFRITEPWARGDFVRAGAWEGWRNGDRPAGAVDEVVFDIGNLDLNYLAFLRGRRDLTAVPPDALAGAAEQFSSSGGLWDGPGLITGPRPEVYLLAINPSVPPYDDAEVRQAVSLTVDRTRLAAENEAGNLSPSTSLLPPSLPGARTDVCQLCTFNPIGARRRLQDAGVRQLRIAFNAGGGHERIRDALRQALSDIDVALVSNGRGPAPSLPDYQAVLEEGSAGLFRLPLVADVPSSLSVLYPLLHSEETPANGGLNYMRYEDPTVDALLEQAARTDDAGSRQSLLRRVEDIALNDDHVVVPVFSYRHAVVVAPRVRNLRYGPFGLVNLTELTLAS